MYVCACICVYCCGTRMRPACVFRLDLCCQFLASDDVANAQIKDLETEICDFKESRIPDDDTFSSEDVRELIDSLQTSIRADAYRNLQRVAHRCVHRTPACAHFKLFTACILHTFLRGWCQLMQRTSQHRGIAAAVHAAVSAARLRSNTRHRHARRREIPS